MNIAKQREKVGKIYLYEIDLGVVGADSKFKYYRVYKRTAFLPFFVTESKGKFSFFGEYEKIIMENNQIKIIGKENQEKEKTKIQLTVDGDVSYMAGAYLILDKTWGKKFSGKYIIDKVDHSVGSEYSCRIEAYKIEELEEKE